MDADEIKEDVDDASDRQIKESGEGDALEYDESAYVMYHRAQTGACFIGFSGHKTAR